MAEDERRPDESAIEAPEPSAAIVPRDERALVRPPASGGRLAAAMNAIARRPREGGELGLAELSALLDEAVQLDEEDLQRGLQVAARVEALAARVYQTHADVKAGGSPEVRAVRERLSEALQQLYLITGDEMPAGTALKRALEQYRTERRGVSELEVGLAEDGAAHEERLLGAEETRLSTRREVRGRIRDEEAGLAGEEADHALVLARAEAGRQLGLAEVDKDQQVGLKCAELERNHQLGMEELAAITWRGAAEEDLAALITAEKQEELGVIQRMRSSRNFVRSWVAPITTFGAQVLSGFASTLGFAKMATVATASSVPNWQILIFSGGLAAVLNGGLLAEGIALQRGMWDFSLRKGGLNRLILASYLAFAAGSFVSATAGVTSVVASDKILRTGWKVNDDNAVAFLVTAEEASARIGISDEDQIQLNLVRDAAERARNEAFGQGGSGDYGFKKYSRGILDEFAGKFKTALDVIAAEVDVEELELSEEEVVIAVEEVDVEELELSEEEIVARQLSQQAALAELQEIAVQLYESLEAQRQRDSDFAKAPFIWENTPLDIRDKFEEYTEADEGVALLSGEVEEELIEIRDGIVDGSVNDTYQLNQAVERINPLIVEIASAVGIDPVQLRTYDPIAHEGFRLAMENVADTAVLMADKVYHLFAEGKATSRDVSVVLSFLVLLVILFDHVGAIGALLVRGMESKVREAERKYRKKLKSPRMSEL